MGGPYVMRSANALRAALRYADVDGSELARRIGVNPETVRRWMRGDTEMRASYLAMIADELDIPIDVLVRPPHTSDEAILQIATWRGMRRASQQP